MQAALPLTLMVVGCAVDGHGGGAVQTADQLAPIAAAIDAGGAAADSASGDASIPGATRRSAGPLRILTLGDSITHATCWRAVLWQQLNQNYAGRFDLVGTLSENNGCTPASYDRDNQGYSSSLVTEVVAGITSARTCDPACPTLDDLSQAFVSTQPDVVLMHFGTNDVWNAKPIDSIVSGYTQIVQAARNANPNVEFMVAQIIPMNVTDMTCAGCTCGNCAADIPALNARIASWAESTSTAASPIVIVDQYSGYDPIRDNRDGVHPNDQGAQKMADRWYTALAPLF